MKSAIVSTMNSGTKSNPAGVYKEEKVDFGKILKKKAATQKTSKLQLVSFKQFLYNNKWIVLLDLMEKVNWWAST